MTTLQERIMLWIFPLLILLSFAWGILYSPLATLTITPATATLGVDETLQLHVEGHNTRHKAVHDVRVTWAVEGKHATITPQGVLTARAPGVVQVTATSDKIRGTARITIEPASVASLTVSSAPASVPVGTSSVLTITAKTAHGKGLPGVTVEAVAMTADSAVTPTQVVTDAAGQATVTLTAAPLAIANTVEMRAGEQRTSVTVQGRAGAPAAVYAKLEPQQVAAGQTVQLQVRVHDQAGNHVPDVPVRFVAGNAATVIAPPEARTDAQGIASTVVQTATKAGGNPVQLHIGQLAPLEVTVLGVAGAPTQLTLHTETAAVVAGAEVPLTARLRDAQDNAVAQMPVTFTLALDTEAAPITTTAMTDATGAATAVLPTGPAAGTVAIQAQALELTAHLPITTHPAIALQIEPATATVAMQGVHTLHAIAATEMGQQGEVVPQWRVQGTAGAITPQGVFTATAIGTATVQAIYGTVQAEARITVVPGEVAAVQITPSAATVTAGTHQRFQGVAVNPHGYPLDIPLFWGVTNAALGNIDVNGMFTAAITGRGNVVASTPELTAQAQVTVTPGALALLVTQPKTVQVQAGEDVQLRVSGRDVAGNVVAVEPTWVLSGEVGELSSQGRLQTRRAGIGNISVTAGTDITADVPVQVVPGELHHLELQPETVTLAAGTEHTFVAVGYDALGNRLAVTPTWRLSADLGPLDPEGTFVAHKAGTAQVQATADNLTVQGTVTVTPGPLVALHVQPAGPLALTAGETVSLRASGEDAYGNRAEPVLQWSQPVPLGTLQPNGTFRAEKAGQGTLEVSSANHSARLHVSIIPGALAQIVVVPAQLVIRAGEKQIFQAKGFDAQDNELPVQATWHATEDIGTMDVQGELTALKTAAGQVRATVGGFAASVPVTVQPGPLAQISVSPERLTLAAGDSVQVTVTGTDAHGNAVTVHPRWELVVETESVYPRIGTGIPLLLKPMIGLIGQEGVFTAQKVGKGQLVVLAEGQKATIPVQVEPGAPAALQMAPTTLRLASGQQHQCTIQGFDRGGNIVPATATWDVQGNVGTLTPDGVFTATMAGQGTLRATVGALVMTATVIVDPGEAVSLRVEPATVTLKAGETSALHVTAVDAAGNQVLTAPLWSVEEALGTVSGAGVFTAHKAGTGKITATLGQATQAVTVDIAPGPLAAITLSPATLAVRVGSKQVFAATGIDAYGNALEVAPTWSMQGPIGRIDAQGQFEATASGTGVVVAVVGNIAGLAAVTVEPTTALRLPQAGPRQTWTVQYLP